MNKKSTILLLNKRMPTDKNVIDSYSDYAEQWAKRRRDGKNIAHMYLEKPAMYGKIPNLTGKKVLCVGCGTGEECDYLQSRGAQEVLGIDVSEGLIKYAQQSYPSIKFQVMDMEKMGFPDNSFDFIYSSLVLHYVNPWVTALTEIRRVLKDNGTFLFSTHHPAVWGGERTRTEKERDSLLGYKKHLDTNTCETVGDYFNTRKIDDVWFGNFNVSYYHRPLSDIFKDIKLSGFEILDFLEPKSVDTVKDIDPVFWEIHQKIPLFMIFELKKKTENSGDLSVLVSTSK